MFCRFDWRRCVGLSVEDMGSGIGCSVRKGAVRDVIEDTRLCRCQ